MSNQADGAAPVERVQILDEDGAVLDGATVPPIDDETLVTIYEQMRLSRHLDERVRTLHRQGRIGTYPPLAGQEAAQVASTHALDDEDWVLYQYREHGTVVARDIAHEYLLYWMGHERGNEWLPERHVFPVNISIASHLPHATGMAWAAKLKGDDTAVVCHFGDGATSEGDFHEALNFAGTFDVPAIFVCNNNQYAISVGTDRQTASATFAQKAHAYGFRGVLVDGMDPLAVYKVTRDAVRRARGEGPGPDESIGRAARPTLIEAETYRLGPHTTVDDPSAYREEAEVEAWRERDPLERFEAFLRDRDLLDDDREAEITERIEREVSALIEQAEAYEADPDAMFEHVFAEETPRIREQREQFRALRERHGDGELQQDE